jgi:hypothetical protein
MPALPEHVPELDGDGLVVELDAELRGALRTAPSPERSPLTSAMNTGTPIFENRSASVCSDTVLPVPVAPVMRPCRFASAGSNESSVAPALATRSGSLIA